MNEFSLEHGKVSKGILSAVGAGLKYMIVPLLIIIFTTALFEQFEGGEILREIGVGEVTTWIVIFGIPITILSFFRGFYPKGSWSRPTFALVVAFLVILWIWFVTMGGNLVLQFGQFGLRVSFTGLVLLFILVAALRGAYFVVEMFSYRREWLASVQEPPATVPPAAPDGGGA